MVELKTPGEIDAIAAAGEVVAAALRAARTAAAVGVRLDHLDEVAASVIRDAGATPAFLGYRPGFASTPFPGVICTSVNDAALHGIPGPYRLADGDLLGVDCGAVLDGWVADAAVTFSVGEPRAADTGLVDCAWRALWAGVDAAVVGARLGDVSAAIGAVGRAGGYGISVDYGGHGVGRAMHESPSVPNEGPPGRGMRLAAGLVIAVEPWFLAGGDDGYAIDADGWTLRSRDGGRAAHVEHTIAVTESGPRVLTSPAHVPA